MQHNPVGHHCSAWPAFGPGNTCGRNARQARMVGISIIIGEARGMTMAGLTTSRPGLHWQKWAISCCPFVASQAGDYFLARQCISIGRVRHHWRNKTLKSVSWPLCGGVHERPACAMTASSNIQCSRRAGNPSTVMSLQRAVSMCA